MPAFLVTFFKWIVTFFAQSIIERVTVYLKKRQAEKEAFKEIDEAAQDALKALKQAKTKEEIDEATRRALDRL